MTSKVTFIYSAFTNIDCVKAALQQSLFWLYISSNKCIVQVKLVFDWFTFTAKIINY